MDVAVRTVGLRSKGSAPRGLRGSRTPGQRPEEGTAPAQSAPAPWGRAKWQALGTSCAGRLGSCWPAARPVPIRPWPVTPWSRSGAAFWGGAASGWTLLGVVDPSALPGSWAQRLLRPLRGHGRSAIRRVPGGRGCSPAAAAGEDLALFSSQPDPGSWGTRRPSLRPPAPAALTPARRGQGEGLAQRGYVGFGDQARMRLVDFRGGGGSPVLKYRCCHRVNGPCVVAVGGCGGVAPPREILLPGGGGDPALWLPPLPSLPTLLRAVMPLEGCAAAPPQLKFLVPRMGFSHS